MKNPPAPPEPASAQAKDPRRFERLVLPMALLGLALALAVALLFKFGERLTARAVMRGDFMTAEFLLNLDPGWARGGNPAQGDAPLVWRLASKEEPGKLSFLLHAGADPNAEHSGYSALDQAIRSRRTEMAQFLLRAGANPNTPGEALVYAAGLPNGGVVEMLLEAGANPNAGTSGGTSALREAVISENLEAVAALLEAGADPNARSKGKTTALRGAVNAGNHQAVTALLDAGADLGEEAAGAPTILLEAVNSKSYKTLKALLDAGADPNAEAAGTTTALHAAVAANHYNMVKALLKAGADPMTLDASGKTPRGLTDNATIIAWLKRAEERAPRRAD